jgi:putative peptidoglycan lipid II flippase
VPLRPRAGWRDPEVLVTIRKALRSVTQAGLLALQLLALLLVSNRVAGGTVAIQMALNFYYLPIALAATPVALALLPRLSRLHQSDSTSEFTSTFIEGLGLALFMAIPAAVGFVVLADPIAHTIAAGQMASPDGLRMIAAGLAALALGLVGETTFYVTTQASYARGDTRTPLVSMGVQAVFCLSLCAVAAFAPTRLLVPAIGGAYAIGAIIGGAHLFLRMSRGWQRRELWGSLGRITFGSIVMAIPAYFSAHLISSQLGGRPGQALALVVGAAVGVIVYAVIQLLLRSPEFAWLTSGLRDRRKTSVVEAG